jgi:hypothetical protein
MRNRNLARIVWFSTLIQDISFNVCLLYSIRSTLSTFLLFYNSLVFSLTNEERRWWWNGFGGTAMAWIGWMWLLGCIQRWNRFSPNCLGCVKISLHLRLEGRPLGWASSPLFVLPQQASLQGGSADKIRAKQKKKKLRRKLDRFKRTQHTQICITHYGIWINTC